MKTFAIIVIYNGMRRDWINKCFSSIESSTIPVQIIAIDNNSTDGSVDFIKNHFPKTILITSEKNLGFGGANNLGLKTALKMGGEYFFLLNQDAWVEPDTIEKLVIQAKQNPEYGIISPLHYNGKGSALDFNFSDQIAPSRCYNLYSDFVSSRVEDRVYTSSFVCAAAWLLTKQSLELVGGFNPIFFHYGEDDNYVHRLHYKGLKLGVYPFAQMYHDREERPKSQYESYVELNKKFLLKDASNPLSKFNIDKHLSILKKKRFISLITLNFKYANELLETIKFIKKNINKIHQNKQISTSDKKYAFL